MKNNVKVYFFAMIFLLGMKVCVCDWCIVSTIPPDQELQRFLDLGCTTAARYCPVARVSTPIQCRRTRLGFSTKFIETKDGVSPTLAPKLISIHVTLFNFYILLIISFLWMFIFLYLLISTYLFLVLAMVVVQRTKDASIRECRSYGARVCIGTD